MTKQEFREMLASMSHGWMTREYDTVAEKFSDHLFYSDSLHYSFSSKQELLEFFRDEDLPERCAFYQTVFDEELQLGAAEYTYEATHVYHGTVWINIENDKITSWREYQHISEESRDEFWKGKTL